MEPNNIPPTVPVATPPVVSMPSVPTVPPVSTLPQASHSLTRNLLIILGAVLILGGGVYYFLAKDGAAPSTKVIPAVSLTTVETKTRSLVASFPKDLILSKDAVIFQSYVQNAATNPATGAPFQISVAIYTTKDFMNTVFTAYNSYFAKSGYTILKSETSADGAKTTVYAFKGAYSVSVVLEPVTTETKGVANTKVVISYGQLTKSIAK